MNTVYARALLALVLVALPVSALASTKSEAKAHKAKHEAKAVHAKPSHERASVAKTEHPTKKSKHHAHQAKDAKGVAANESRLKSPAH